MSNSFLSNIIFVVQIMVLLIVALLYRLIQVFTRDNSQTENMLIAVFRKIDRKHEQIAEIGGDVAKATRVVAGLATIGAVLATPSGLTSAGIAIGLVSAPFLVAIAPVLVLIAGAAATFAAATHLYSKRRRLSEESHNRKNAP